MLKNIRMSTQTTNPLLEGTTATAAAMDGAEFERLFEEIISDKPIREGSVVNGTVIRIVADKAVIDIAYKSEGTIPLREFKDGEGNLTIDVGAEVEVYLESLEGQDGMLVLSKEKADLMKAWDKIQEAVENDEVVEGTIVSRVKGGLSVDIGVRAFLPGSQVDLRPVKNLERLIGATATFKIIKFNKKRGNIVLSRRALLEIERSARRDETIQKLKVGAIIDGTVKNITDYGAFIDLGGIDGLLHITDMSWGRISHPSEMFSVGDEVQVRILKFDADTQRVSLGYKQLKEDPWNFIGERYPIGCVVRGKVVSMPDYGIFVELEEGIEGLVHISEMTWNKRVKHPSKLVDLETEVEAVVLDIDLEQKRISLGMKQLEDNPWDVVEQKFPIGSVVTGQVRNITDFGIFVGIEDGIDGLVHISDLSWSQRINHPSERYEKGDDVEAKVLKIDKENERFSLGIKQMTDDPWESVAGKYFLSQVLECKVVHATEFGVFVELEEGIEGLVHLSELAGDLLSDRYEVGAALKVEVISVDPHEQKIGLGEVSDGDVPTSTEQSTGTATLADTMGADMLDALGVGGEEPEAESSEPVEESDAAEAADSEAAEVSDEDSDGTEASAEDDADADASEEAEETADSSNDEPEAADDADDDEGDAADDESDESAEDSAGESDDESDDESGDESDDESGDEPNDS